MSASTGWRSRSEQAGSLPERFFHAHDGVARKIVRPNNERVVVKSLSPGGLVIGVAETHESIPEEGSKLSSRIFQLCTGGRSFQDLCKVGPHLDLSMPVVIRPSRKLGPLAAGENRLRHLEFRKLFSERNQLISGDTSRSSLCRGAEAVAKCQQGIEGNKTLIIQHRTNSFRQLPVDSLTLRAGLIRTSEQINYLLLGALGFAGSSAQ